MPAFRRRTEDVRLDDPVGKHMIKALQDQVKLLMFESRLHNSNDLSFKAEVKLIYFLSTLYDLYGHKATGSIMHPAESLDFAVIVESDNQYVIAFTDTADDRLRISDGTAGAVNKSKTCLFEPFPQVIGNSVSSDQCDTRFMTNRAYRCAPSPD